MRLLKEAATALIFAATVAVLVVWFIDSNFSEPPTVTEPPMVTEADTPTTWKFVTPRDTLEVTREGDFFRVRQWPVARLYMKDGQRL